MKIILASVLAALLAGGCASMGQRDRGERLLASYEPYLGEPIQSFTALQHDSWLALNRTQLVLWTTINDAYLLTITNNCPELPFADYVGVTSTTSQITTFDSVIVRGNRCPIEQIRPIDVRQMRKDRFADDADDSSRAT